MVETAASHIICFPISAAACAHRRGASGQAGGALARHWAADVRVIAVALPHPRYQRRGPGAGPLDPLSALSRAGPVRNQYQIRHHCAPLSCGCFDRPPRLERRGLPKRRPPRPPATAANVARPGLRDLYRQIMLFPDRYRSWIGAATRAGLDPGGGNGNPISSIPPAHPIPARWWRRGWRRFSACPGSRSCAICGSAIPISTVIGCSTAFP